MSGPLAATGSWLRGRAALARGRVGLVGGLAVLLAALALQALLDGGWWLPRTLVTVGSVVAAGWVVRLLSLPAPLQPLVQAGALVTTLTILFARAEAAWGLLPSPASMGQLRDLIVEGRKFAEDSVPPAGADLGLLLLIAAGVGLVALAVDTLAAGLDLPGVTLIPLAAMFGVPWVITHGTLSASAFVLVAAGWLAVLSAAQRDRAAQWSPYARTGSSGIGLLVAAATLVLALLSGALATLGGPTTKPTLGTGIGGRGGSVELDALVSLRRSLVSNDDRVILSLTSTAQQPDYLRLAVLEDFDGEQWRPAGPSRLEVEPPAIAGAGGSGSLVEYRIDVGPLTGTTLPSPAGTIASQNDFPVAWDQRTSLPERTDGESIDGTRIGLVVTPNRLDGPLLRAQSQLSGTQWGAVTPADLADPEPLVGPELPGLAREITSGTATPYDAAVALQAWFTSEGGFTYSTQIPGGSDEDALASFLADRVGYCEQFAATMALMARSVGIPSRVVVGFTQGRLEEGRWVVRGTDAHAWPELWMGDAGWVRFEPTPGAPSTITPAYSRADSATEAPTTPATDGPEAPEAEDSGVPAQVPDFEGAAGGTGGTGGELSPVGWILTGALVLMLLAPAAIRAVRRVRRLRIGDGESAYREVTDTLVDLGQAGQASTPRTTLSGAARLSDDPGVQAALARIQRAVEWQRYGAPHETPGDRGPGRARDRVTVQASAQGRASATTLAQRDELKPTPAPDDRAGVGRTGSADLAADVRTARRALLRRAGWPRRAGAVLLPRSVLGSALERLTGGSG